MSDQTDVFMSEQTETMEESSAVYEAVDQLVATLAETRSKISVTDAVASLVSSTGASVSLVRTALLEVLDDGRLTLNGDSTLEARKRS